MSPTLPVNIIILFSFQSLQHLLSEKLFNDAEEVFFNFAMPILEQRWKGISESNSSSIIGFDIFIKLAFELGFCYVSCSHLHHDVAHDNCNDGFIPMLLQYL